MDSPTIDQVQELALRCLGDAGIEVTVTEGGIKTEDGVFGLEPLRCRLAGHDRDTWLELVRDHFEALVAIEPVVPDSFAEARPRLRSAVVSEKDLGWFDGALMERTIADGLGERLMIRHGSVGMTVTAETMQSWDVNPDEVWEAARDGSVWDEAIVRDVFRRGSVIFTAIRGGIWTSTRITDLDRFVDSRLDFGVVAVVPARDEVLFHQVRDETFAEAAVAMLEHAGRSYMEAPYPVGCDLHWWGEGRLHRIGTPGPDGYRYLRVPEFSDTLRRLEADLEGGAEGTG